MKELTKEQITRVRYMMGLFLVVPLGIGILIGMNTLTHAQTEEKQEVKEATVEQVVVIREFADRLEEPINEWFMQNQDVEITRVLQQTLNNDTGGIVACFIYYKKKE